jgi:integrase
VLQPLIIANRNSYPEVQCSQVFCKHSARNQHSFPSEAGLPHSVRFHHLRHTCATLLLGKGVHPAR